MIPEELSAEIEDGLARLGSELHAEGIDLDLAERHLFRAPGRVNLIGDHTDYNGGLVLPAAIDLAVYLACVPSEGVYLVSLSESGTLAITSDGDSALDGRPIPPWGAYPRGVLAELAREGRPPAGFSGVVASSIPVGRGLSSSAALEVAVATAALALAGFELDAWRTAEACRRAEERYAGVECGIMDQAVSVMGKAGFACLIDTARHTFEHIPVPRSIDIVVIDSGIRRELAGGEYNRRRRECSAALDALRSSKEFAGLEHLCDLRPDDIGRFVELLPVELARRVRHVVTENARVERVCRILREVAASDPHDPPSRLLRELGAVLEESHRSVVADFGAGHPTTDRIVELAAAESGYIGARQTGAGWGGAVVVFCTAGAGGRLGQSILDALPGEEQAIPAERPSAATPSYHVCVVSDGASEI